MLQFNFFSKMRNALPLNLLVANRAVNPTVHCDLFALHNVSRATLSSLSLVAIVAMDVSHFDMHFSSM